MSDAISVREAAIDPKWQTSGLTFDGATHTVLTIWHPSHGETHHILPRSSAAALRDALISVLAD